jgi:hypothetical protein
MGLHHNSLESEMKHPRKLTFLSQKAPCGDFSFLHGLLIVVKTWPLSFEYCLCTVSIGFLGPSLY